MATKTRQILNKLPMLFGLFYGMNLLGAWLFMLAEQGVSFGASVYWAFITSLSVGYGDISPSTITGRIVAVLLANFVLLFVIPILVTIFSQKAVEDRNEFNHEEQEEMKALLRELKAAVCESNNKTVGV